MDKVLAATEARRRLLEDAPGEVSACITLEVRGSCLVVNNSVALAMMGLLVPPEAAEAIVGLLVTIVWGCGLTSLSLRATHKSLEVSALSWLRRTVIQATYKLM